METLGVRPENRTLFSREGPLMDICVGELGVHFLIKYFVRYDFCIMHGVDTEKEQDGPRCKLLWNSFFLVISCFACF